MSNDGDVEVPDGWSIQQLGDVSKITMGQSPPSSTYNDNNNGLPFYQGKADFGNKYPVTRFWCTEPTKIAHANSILFSVRAPVGDVNFSATECCIGRGLSSIIGTEALTHFLYQYIQHNKNGFQLLSQGSTFEAINGTELKEFPIITPPLPEQKKIASILTSVDDVIEKTEAQINKLQDLKKGMMTELLTKGIGHTEFKDSPVGRIPVSWEIATCGDICTEVVVGIVIKPTQYYQDEGVPALRSANVREEGLNNDNLKYISNESNALLKKSMLREGDIVTVRTGYPGTTAVVTKEFVGCNCVDLIISRPSLKVNSSFLALWVNSDIGKGQVLKVQGGLAQQHFNVGEMKKMLIALPSIEEQNQIVKCHKSLTENIVNKSDKLSHIKSLKKALMNDLLTGKKRVNVN